MAAKRRLDGGLRLRRGRRTDLARLGALLSDQSEPRVDRFRRRALADLSHDVYVAETPAGELVGIVAVGYVRSLQPGRFAAVLDTARAAPGAEAPLLDALLDLAEARARRRGCGLVRAWVAPDDGVLRAALAARGWHVEETLERRLPTDG